MLRQQQHAPSPPPKNHKNAKILSIITKTGKKEASSLQINIYSYFLVGRMHFFHIYEHN